MLRFLSYLLFVLILLAYSEKIIAQEEDQAPAQQEGDNILQDFYFETIEGEEFGNQGFDQEPVEIKTIIDLSLDALGLRKSEGALFDPDIQNPWQNNSKDDLIALVRQVDFAKLNPNMRSLISRLLLTGGTIEINDNDASFFEERLKKLVESGRAITALKLIELLPLAIRQAPSFKIIEIENLIILSRYDEACIEIEQFLEAGDKSIIISQSDIACKIYYKKWQDALRALEIFDEFYEREPLHKNITTTFEQLSTLNIYEEGKDYAKDLAQEIDLGSIENSFDFLFFILTQDDKNLKNTDKLNDANMLAYILSKRYIPKETLEIAVARGLLSYKNLLRLLSIQGERYRNIVYQLNNPTKNQEFTQQTLLDFKEINCRTCRDYLLAEIFVKAVKEDSYPATIDRLHLSSSIAASGRNTRFLQYVLPSKEVIQNNPLFWPLALLSYFGFTGDSEQIESIESLLKDSDKTFSLDREFLADVEDLIYEERFLLQALKQNIPNINQEVNSNNISRSLLLLANDLQNQEESLESTAQLVESLTELGFTFEAHNIALNFLTRPRLSWD